MNFPQIRGAKEEFGVKIRKTKLEGVIEIEPDVHTDHRGFFMETYSKKKWAEFGLHVDFVQDNHSLSTHAGTIRGLHYQREPAGQAKLVRVVAGAVFDVAVDIRPGSPTFGRWHGVVLSAANKRQLFIPRGFAHGFCTLEPNTEVVYKTDGYYDAEHDAGIRWDDPDIAVRWPADRPVLSDKDRNHPLLREVFPA